MNKPTSNHIEQLLNQSGLIPLKSKLNLPFESFNFEHETILITGAAGSIGSELSKQLLNSTFKKLILVDIAESPLYNLITDFENIDTLKIHFLLLNITESDSVEYLFETYKPTIVFHAAAYKHVPLMEENAFEAVKTNIHATKLLADVSIKINVKKFIFISTDKAVNPMSVMGITKLIAENYLLSLNCKNHLFLIARFGNIIGSNGSVLPLFIKQIDSGKPITITDKAISRFFIGKQNACSLILTMATFKKYDSAIFTFDMGKPIKILDLATKLIELYCDVNEDIKLRYTGLRPGEKLHEDMVSSSEYLLPTENKSIFIVKNLAEKKIMDLDAITKISPRMSNLEIKSILTSFIKN